MDFDSRLDELMSQYGYTEDEARMHMAQNGRTQKIGREGGVAVARGPAEFEVFGEEDADADPFAAMRAKPGAPKAATIPEEPDVDKLLESVSKGEVPEGVNLVPDEELSEFMDKETGKVDQKGLAGFLQKRLIPVFDKLIPGQAGVEDVKDLVTGLTADFGPKLEEVLRVVSPYVKTGIVQLDKVIRPVLNKAVEMTKKAAGDVLRFTINDLLPQLTNLLVVVVSQVVQAVVDIVVSVVINAVKAAVIAKKLPSDSTDVLTIAGELRKTFADSEFQLVVAGKSRKPFDNGVLAVHNTTGQPIKPLVGAMNAFARVQGWLTDKEYDELHVGRDMRMAFLDQMGLGIGEKRSMRIGDLQDALREALSARRMGISPEEEAKEAARLAAVGGVSEEEWAEDDEAMPPLPAQDAPAVMAMPPPAPPPPGVAPPPIPRGTPAATPEDLPDLLPPPPPPSVAPPTFQTAPQAIPLAVPAQVPAPATEEQQLSLQWRILQQRLEEYVNPSEWKDDYIRRPPTFVRTLDQLALNPELMPDNTEFRDLVNRARVFRAELKADDAVRQAAREASGLDEVTQAPLRGMVASVGTMPQSVPATMGIAQTAMGAASGTTPAPGQQQFSLADVQAMLQQQQVQLLQQQLQQQQMSLTPQEQQVAAARGATMLQQQLAPGLQESLLDPEELPDVSVAGSRPEVKQAVATTSDGVSGYLSRGGQAAVGAVGGAAASVVGQVGREAVGILGTEAFQTAFSGMSQSVVSAVGEGAGQAASAGVTALVKRAKKPSSTRSSKEQEKRAKEKAKKKAAAQKAKDKAKAQKAKDKAKATKAKDKAKATKAKDAAAAKKKSSSKSKSKSKPHSKAKSTRSTSKSKSKSKSKTKTVKQPTKAKPKPKPKPKSKPKSKPKRPTSTRSSRSRSRSKAMKKRGELTTQELQMLQIGEEYDPVVEEGFFHIYNHLADAEKKEAEYDSDYDSDEDMEVDWDEDDLHPMSMGEALDYMFTEDPDFERLVSGELLVYECGPIRVWNEDGLPMPELRGAREVYLSHPMVRPAVIGGLLDRFSGGVGKKARSGGAVSTWLNYVSQAGQGSNDQVARDGIAAAKQIMEKMNDSKAKLGFQQRLQYTSKVVNLLVEVMDQITLFELPTETAARGVYPMLADGTEAFRTLMLTVSERHKAIRGREDSLEEGDTSETLTSVLEALKATADYDEYDMDSDIDEEEVMAIAGIWDELKGMGKVAIKPKSTRGGKKKKDDDEEEVVDEGEEEEGGDGEPVVKTVSARVILQKGVGDEMFERAERDFKFKQQDVAPQTAKQWIDVAVRNERNFLTANRQTRLDQLLRLALYTLVGLISSKDIPMANAVTYMVRDRILSPVLAVPPTELAAFFQEMSKGASPVRGINIGAQFKPHETLDHVEQAMRHARHVGDVLWEDQRFGVLPGHTRRVIVLLPIADDMETVTMHNAKHRLDLTLVTDLEENPFNSSVSLWGPRGEEPYTILDDDKIKVEGSALADALFAEPNTHSIQLTKVAERYDPETRSHLSVCKAREAFW